jgi:hypothetical protein
MKKNLNQAYYLTESYAITVSKKASHYLGKYISYYKKDGLYYLTDRYAQ